MQNKIIDKIRALNIHNSEMWINSETWINEAEFGFSCLTEYCKQISKSGKVLEVGCGTGIYYE